jgi:hypothetical protein
MEKKISPAPIHLLLSSKNINIGNNEIENRDVYLRDQYYPTVWYDYNVGCGLNDGFKHVTYVVVDLYTARYNPVADKLMVADSAELKISYVPPEENIFSTDDEYDLVIIAPVVFNSALDKLAAHKNDYGVKTFVKTTDEIYNEYSGVDKPEQIKLFIKDAMEKNNIKYVLLVGGLKNIFWNNPKENTNYGERFWHIPVRYNNFYDNPEHPLSYEKIHDPGILSDLYYADVYGAGGQFDDWDPNGDGFIAAWGRESENIENDTGIDFYPDVALGRLACRSVKEANDVVDKIINYEKSKADDSWFKKMISISGDGFMDQQDLDIKWDTNGLPDGKYTIIGESKTADGPFGVPDTIQITIDKGIPTSLSFNHDDNERIDGYPSDPIAEIVSVSDGDVLGNSDFTYEPSEREAYGNSVDGWANINYTDGILHIRGKTYDPSPYGNATNIRVKILNENQEIIFEDWRNGSEMYYEGEWVTGEETLMGGGGALYYMPDDFEKKIIWASNGKLTGQDSVIAALSEGSGFAFLSGHGSPNVWSDHLPGIPGNRMSGSVTGLKVTSLKIYPNFFSFPLFPMEKITNHDKLPIILIGGCHNSQFNVSMIPGLFDIFNKRNTWCHGAAVPECFSWYLVKMPKTGAIATIGNTGLGYGVPGKPCLVEGLDGGICIEFFKEYGIQYDTYNGEVSLGNVYKNVLTTYLNSFDVQNSLDHAKSLTQWVLLGDPSLMIGGYSL